MTADNGFIISLYPYLIETKEKYVKMQELIRKYQHFRDRKKRDEKLEVLKEMRATLGIKEVLDIRETWGVILETMKISAARFRVLEIGAAPGVTLYNYGCPVVVLEITNDFMVKVRKLGEGRNRVVTFNALSLEKNP